MDYDIRVIPHNAQRYDTVGDYYQKRDDLKVLRISSFHGVEDLTEMQAEDYEFLIMIHELIEQHLAKKSGISDEEIDKFDMQFEDDRKKGLHNPDEEPGNDPECPIYYQHKMATQYEKMLAVDLGVDWYYYDRIVQSMTQEVQENGPDSKANDGEDSETEQVHA
jgi:hypothetical protein